MKLSYRRTFCVGFAFLSICAFWQLYDSIIPLMLKNSFHLKETVSGAIMAIDNVLALFLLPLLGCLLYTSIGGGILYGERVGQANAGHFVPSFFHHIRIPVQHMPGGAHTGPPADIVQPPAYKGFIGV